MRHQGPQQAMGSAGWSRKRGLAMVFATVSQLFFLQVDAGLVRLCTEEAAGS